MIVLDRPTLLRVLADHPAPECGCLVCPAVGAGIADDCFCCCRPDESNNGVTWRSVPVAGLWRVSPPMLDHLVDGEVALGCSLVAGHAGWHLVFDHESDVIPDDVAHADRLVAAWGVG